MVDGLPLHPMVTVSAAEGAATGANWSVSTQEGTTMTLCEWVRARPPGSRYQRGRCAPSGRCAGSSRHSEARQSAGWRRTLP